MKLEMRLYFRCDEKYTLRHKCKFLQFQGIIASKDEKDAKLKVEEEEEPDIEEREMELTLNLNFVVGFDTLKTMKFVKFFKGKEVVILLDSEVTHNFISRALVEELKLPMTPACFAVTLRDERILKGIRRCDSMELQFHRMIVNLNFFLFELGSVDIILGMDW